MAVKGVKRVAVMVKAEHADLFHKLALLSRMSVDDDAGWASIMADPIEFFEEVRRSMEAAERGRD
jgi:hypothetical protein